MKKLISLLFLLTSLSLHARVISRPVSVRPVSRPVVHRATPSVRVNTSRPTVRTVSTPKYRPTTVKSSPIITSKFRTDNVSDSNTVYRNNNNSFLTNWFLYRAISNKDNNTENYDVDKTIWEIEQRLKKLSLDPIKNKNEIEFLTEILKRLKARR